ncbi:MAG: hypothetical protein ACI853_001673, partial [Paracoccaceae bacterium]
MNTTQGIYALCVCHSGKQTSCKNLCASVSMVTADLSFSSMGS